VNQFAIIQILSTLCMVSSHAAVTTFTSRSAFESETFTITTSEDFSSSPLNLIIGDTVVNRFTSGVITISSNVRESTEGNYRAAIRGSTHPDRFNDSNFAALESFGSASTAVDLRNETATILLSGANQVFGMDLGSFAAQTTAYFRTNLGNSFAFSGNGSIGTNSFAGAISDQAGEYFTRIDFEITGGSTFSDGFGIDNLVAGAIPEPSAIAFLALLPTFLLVRRKK
jgi:hypothetical protein